MPGSPARPGAPAGMYGSGPLGGGGGGGAEAVMGMGSNAIALAQAYQTRMAALSSVAASLLSKREAMVHQLARVQSRMGEVAAAREAIESETLADMEAVLHRLRAAEAGKFAVLQKDADVLMSDITSTDAFYAALTSFQPSQQQQQQQAPPQQHFGAPDAGAAALYDPATALQFMRAYPELCAEADRLSVKAIRTDCDVSAEDFEREVANRNELASRYAALVDLVAAKDRIILQLLKVRARGRRRCRARDPEAFFLPFSCHTLPAPRTRPRAAPRRRGRRAPASAKTRAAPLSARPRGASPAWRSKRPRRWSTGCSEWRAPLPPAPRRPFLACAADHQLSFAPPLPRSLADKLTGELNQVAEKLMRVHMGSEGEEESSASMSAASAAASGAAAALASRVAGRGGGGGGGGGGRASLGGAGGIALGGASGGLRRPSLPHAQHAGAAPPQQQQHQHVVEVEGMLHAQHQQPLQHAGEGGDE
jgi:hypothetical protein